MASPPLFMTGMVEQGNDLLDHFDLGPFHPLPFLRSGMKQTIAAFYWPRVRKHLPQSFIDIKLPDGDQLRLIQNKPNSWKNGQRIAILVHGLAGNSASSYMVRAAQKIFSRGINVISVNLRGCGEGFGLARNIYHAGRSDDIRQILKVISQQYSKSPVSMIGYSLGANIILKMAGEDGQQISGNMDSLLAISPPVDLEKTSAQLKASENILFDQFFLWGLRLDINKMHKKFPDLPKPKIPMAVNLVEFDDIYTAPRAGFKNALDYYQQSSAAPWVQKINVPGLIVCAIDDPIIHTESVFYLKRPPHIDLIMPSHGGHVGFLAKQADVQWMDQLILAWLKNI
jgi:predicted alpha/beta-fold hydrolase